MAGTSGKYNYSFFFIGSIVFLTIMTARTRQMYRPRPLTVTYVARPCNAVVVERPCSDG